MGIDLREVVIHLCEVMSPAIDFLQRLHSLIFSFSSAEQNAEVAVCRFQDCRTLKSVLLNSFAATKTEEFLLCMLITSDNFIATLK